MVSKKNAANVLFDLRWCTKVGSAKLDRHPGKSISPLYAI
jgi:hypothetical protein